jgi:glycosyltransferase involved in cell wall biosynthesis
MKGENWFLTGTDKEWLEKLSLLARDKELRRWVGQKGRETVEKHYSLKLLGPKVASLYKSLI